MPKGARLAALALALLPAAGLAVPAVPGAAAPAASASGEAARPGAIEGRVTEAGTSAPVADVTVLVVGSALSAVTDDRGRFRIAGVPAGEHRLRFVAGAFRDEDRTVSVVDGQTASLDVALFRPVFSVPTIVVTASREAERPGDAPVSLAVMTADQVARRNVVTLDEALPFAQGVIFNSGQMDIRGATGLARGVGSRVLMLVDGHRVLSGVGAAIEFESLPILDLERIEIVKGPHSTLFGTNALGGVVNVITKRPPADPETIVRGWYGLFDTPDDHDFTDETLSLRGIALQHSRRFGEVGSTLFVGREASDGFRQNGRVERWRVRSKTMFPVGSANPWELFASWTREDAEEFFTWLSADRPLEVDPVELGDWVRTDDLVIGVTASPLVTPTARLQVRPQIHHGRSRNHFHDNEDFHRSTRVGADVQLSLFPHARHAVTVGAEGATTGVSSNFLDPDPDVTDLAVYVQDEIALSDRVEASIGLRLDHHEATGADRDLVVNPKLGVVWRPSERVSLRSSISRGYRAPSISEQFTATTVFGFRVVPNPDLTGESAWAAEIGGTAALGDRVRVDASLFWSEYEGLIEPSPAPDELFTFQFQNVSDARVRGLDAGVRVALAPELLDLGVNYVFLDTEDARTGRALPYRSSHNLTTTVEGWRGLVAVDLRHRSRVDEVLVYPLDERGAITVADLRVGVRVLGTDIQAKVENLFQAAYVDVQERSPGQTRTFRLTLTPRF